MRGRGRTYEESVWRCFLLSPSSTPLPLQHTHTHTRIHVWFIIKRTCTHTIANIHCSFSLCIYLERKTFSYIYIYSHNYFKAICRHDDKHLLFTGLRVLLFHKCWFSRHIFKMPKKENIGGSLRRDWDAAVHKYSHLSNLSPLLLETLTSASTNTHTHTHTHTYKLFYSSVPLSASSSPPPFAMGALLSGVSSAATARLGFGSSSPWKNASSACLRASSS